MAYTGKRKEEPMETDDKHASRRYQGTNLSISNTHTSTGSSASNYQPPLWCFFSEEVLFVKRFFRRDLDPFIRNGEIELEEKEEMLTIFCRTTSHAKVITDNMQKLKSRIAQLKSHKATVNFKKGLPFSCLTRIEKYVEERNTKIENGYLHKKSGWVDVYGLDDAATKREKNLLEALKREIESDSGMPPHASQQYPGSLVSGAKTTAGSSSKPSQPRHNQSLTPSSSHPVSASHAGAGRSPLFTTREGIKVYLYKHSITALQTDAIVNAANEDLKHIGGVAKLISQKAGAVVEYECSSIISRNGGSLSVTDNVYTQAGFLMNKYIIHAVGPRWRLYLTKEHCLNDLSWTVEYALNRAADLGCAHVGMPAISAGIFWVPKVLCAEMYIRGIVNHSEHAKAKSCLKEIHIVDIDDEIIQEIQKAYKKWQANPKSLEPKESYRQFSSGSTRPKSSQHASGSRHHNDVPVAGCSSTRNGDGRSTFWLHCDPSRITGLDDSVQNFESDDGFFKVKIYTGSIVRVRDVNAILCSADNILSGQGPLGSAIRTAGGHQYERSFKTLQDRAYSSREKVFKCEAGNLPVQYVVHVIMDTMATVDMHILQRYKQQVGIGFEKVNSWKLKAIALPLVGAGFVEKNKTDLERVCEAMQETLMTFCRKEKNCKLCEVHLVNRNPRVTDTLVKTFTKNSVPDIKRPQQNPKTNEATAGFQQEQKGARPKSSTYGLDLPGNCRQQEGSHRKSPSKSLSKSVGYHSQNHTYSQKFNETVKPPSWTAFEESNTSKDALTESLRNTRLKQTLSPGNMNILDGTQAKASKNRSEVFTNRLRQSDEQKRCRNNVCSICKASNAEMTTLQCGHSFCAIPCFLPMLNNRICAICHMKDKANSDGQTDYISDEESSDEYHDADDTVGMDDQKTDDMCVICMDAITDQKKLLCGHVFCGDCITQSMAHKPACPVCGKIFGELEGDQPKDGTMTVKKDKYSSLPGYGGDGTIEIIYKFQDGIQKENHPNPLKPYKGTERRAFLPGNREGQKVLRLLQKAFDSRLTFTIGSSRTTGQEDVVTWNDIHHKTKRDGGAAKFGYPDPTYLSRVQDELAAKGITE